VNQDNAPLVFEFRQTKTGARERSRENVSRCRVAKQYKKFNIEEREESGKTNGQKTSNSVPVLCHLW
jgi:hypothetical protein